MSERTVWELHAARKQRERNTVEERAVPRGMWTRNQQWAREFTIEEARTLLREELAARRQAERAVDELSERIGALRERLGLAVDGSEDYP